jgi:hypothetical protein
VEEVLEDLGIIALDESLFSCGENVEKCCVMRSERRFEDMFEVTMCCNQRGILGI